MRAGMRRRAAGRWGLALAAVVLGLVGCGGGTLTSTTGNNGNGNGGGNNGGNGNGVGGTTLTGLLYGATASPRNGIYTVKTDATGEARIVDGSASPTSPRFRFDGKKVAYSANVTFTTAPTVSRLFTVNVDGTGKTQLQGSVLFSNAYRPSFSPDGKSVVFVGDATNATDRDVFAITLATGVVTRLTTLGTGISADYPVYSPDGSKILFMRRRTNGTVVESDLYQMNADGSNPIALTTTHKEDQPNYSQDGSRIVFVSARDGNEEIYVMNANGSSPVRLTNNAANERAPVFSPDGTYIAFLSDRAQAGAFKIYSMKVDGTNVNVFSDAVVDFATLDWR